MALFTVEVSGRPVIVFSDDDRARAEELVASTIGPGLLVLEEAGAPVWVGEHELTVREAEPEEAAHWQRDVGLLPGVKRSNGPGEFVPEGYAVLLVEVDPDPSED
jgi:hypothetical protein